MLSTRAHANGRPRPQCRPTLVTKRGRAAHTQPLRCTILDVINLRITSVDPATARCFSRRLFYNQKLSCCAFRPPELSTSFLLVRFHPARLRGTHTHPPAGVDESGWRSVVPLVICHSFDPLRCHRHALLGQAKIRHGMPQGEDHSVVRFVVTVILVLPVSAEVCASSFRDDHVEKPVGVQKSLAPRA